MQVRQSTTHLTQHARRDPAKAMDLLSAEAKERMLGGGT